MLAFAGMSMLVPEICAQSFVDDHVDSLVSSTRIVEFGDSGLVLHLPDDDATRQKIETFYYDQFRHSQDPEAPYFLFMSKDGGMSMGIGGAVRMRGWFDWGGAIPVNSFTPYLIPMTPDPTKSKRIGTTPAGVCLYFRALGTSAKLGNHQLYIEANFNGYGGRDFYLKKAYATLGDLTVGYASTTFSDPAAVPATVDAAGPNNKIEHTTVLVRYMPRLSRHWLAAVSVETPEPQIPTNDIVKPCASYLPDLSAFLQYEWVKGQHVRLAGIVRSLPYRNMVDERNLNVPGWGVNLSSVARLTNSITTYATFNYGCGIGAFNADLMVGNYDLTPRIGDPSRMYAPRSFGWCVGVQYNFSHNLFATLIASQTRYLPSRGAMPDDYKYGMFQAVNVFWNPIPRIQLGAELDWGSRHNFSNEHHHARRVGMVAQVSF